MPFGPDIVTLGLSALCLGLAVIVCCIPCPVCRQRQHRDSGRVDLRSHR